MLLLHEVYSSENIKPILINIDNVISISKGAVNTIVNCVNNRTYIVKESIIEIYKKLNGEYL